VSKTGRQRMFWPKQKYAGSQQCLIATLCMYC